MRVLQLIDSLEAGGAERVAVNYANGLLGSVDGSYLCATRAEGLLKSNVNKRVGYLFLKKTKTLDFKAIWALHRFVKKEKITLIHAHSTSYFLATLITILNSKVKLVWHDHYGKSEFLKQRPQRVLKYCSNYFNHIFSVNLKLEQWAKTCLNTKSVSYLPNYAVLTATNLKTDLKGVDGKRVVCLANLRPQKDHFNLLQAFQILVAKYPDWTLHLVGKDFKDEYSKHISKFILTANLEQHIFVYGSCNDTSAILKSSTIGVLSSQSEGLPLALLEYGLAGLAVVATNVGDCSQVIQSDKTGLLVNPKDELSLFKAIERYIQSEALRDEHSKHLQRLVTHSFSERNTIQKLTNTYLGLY
ncbi:glycosyltransferase [uncultured Olleya sp.]|uniref:glycosyltransferase n=1 Tax=uncultured Olleya sp. TaxID=757243 RepID=UPI002591EFAD|nr:glycosyltransferase [uncultured Olleya sp.]